MKFLCDNCKAKYQIADEKLQGRSVQMKCRKCGHMIVVPALTPAPGAAAPHPPEPARPAHAVEAPKPAAGAAAKPASPAAKPAPTAPKPAAPKPAASPLRPALAPRAAPARPAPPARTPGASGSHPQPGQAGLAGAFAKSVKEQGKPAPAAPAPPQEWYVGVNGVPLGPVKVGVIAQKAAQGAVDEDSLVWREGFDEWLPLRQFPELVAVIEEARAQAAAAGAPPPAKRPSVRPPGPNVGAGRSAAMDAGAQTAPPADALGLSSAGPVLAGVTPPPSHVADVMGDPFALPREPVPSPSAGRVSFIPESIARPSVVDEMALGVRKQVRLHPAAGVFIALLGVLGGVLVTIWVLGGKAQPVAPPTVQIVTVTAPPSAGPVPATSTSALAMADTAAPADTSRPTQGGAAPANTRPDSKKDDPKSATTAPPLNVGMDTPGLEGPNVGGPTPGAANASLPQLEQADIQRVVSSNVGFVRRQCWEPALASRSPTAPSTAKVNVMVTIGADGRVVSATASGGAGYPDLASCVASRVRNWKFPPSSGQSTANVPFVFAAQ